MLVREGMTPTPAIRFAKVGTPTGEFRKIGKMRARKKRLFRMHSFSPFPHFAVSPFLP